MSNVKCFITSLQIKGAPGDKGSKGLGFPGDVSVLIMTLHYDYILITQPGDLGPPGSEGPIGPQGRDGRHGDRGRGGQKVDY